MNFIADLHIHSRFSRATSKALTPGHLAAWAACKGIAVLGTGDFTHPQWRAELREQLERDDASGLYRLKGMADRLDFMDSSREAASAPLFCLQAEISSIYKRQGKVRKIHNLIYVPTLEDAERLSQRLGQIGNLNADGRPILGLDSRDLLEITLETTPDAVLIPAHIWTPWFALFGSRSGFDRLEDCFGDLSSHIFALETGLSSDPAMNRMVSSLDGYALISNSDAHSGANLGREGNLFAGQPSYSGMFDALRAAARREVPESPDCRFLGTLEFYPEEGKYHLDGHRACNVMLEPRDSRALGNICPVCGKPLTIGVLHRVLELADRETPAALPQEPEARALIPLPELLGEILGVGPTSRKVQQRYAQLLNELGPELDILCSLPETDIRTHWEALGEAVARMRRGQVFRQGGYDGEYGVVRVFAPDELPDKRGRSLPGLGAAAGRRGRPRKSASTEVSGRAPLLPLFPSENVPEQNQLFSAEQRTALQAGPGPVLVAAGPGAGKTRVLIGRLQWLLEQGNAPHELLALTFTRRAAGEMRERLATALPQTTAMPRCDTLHGLAWSLVQEQRKNIHLLDEDAAFRMFCIAQTADKPLLTPDEKDLRKLWDVLQLAREKGAAPAAGSPLALAAARYTAYKQADSQAIWLDYSDLLEALLLQAPLLTGRWRHILVDEAQDLSPLQLSAIRALLPENGQGFFGIGDPDQAIYGFRGASGQSEDDLRACWPDLTVCRLGQSYRASQGVLDMAQNLMQGQGQCGPLHAVRQSDTLLRLFAASDDKAEARWLAGRVQRLLGATSHSLLDIAHRRADTADCVLDGTLAPGDIAVLVRLKAQMPPLLKALEQAGIPCTAPARQDFRHDPVCSRFLAMAAAACHMISLYQDRAQTDEHTALPWCGADLPEPLAMTAWLSAQPWAVQAGEEPGKSAAWRELCCLWAQCGSWPAFFDRLAWLDEAEMLQSKAERVQIMTLHASKGLEFKAVFLPGLEDGLLPLRRELLWESRGNHSDEGSDMGRQLAEERRLLYVGITRAAQGIFISHCQRRSFYGRELRLAPSPFLTQISDFCRQSTLTRHKRKSEVQLSLL
ncbi:MAG: UvrD-helicase domain-containing protein [Desulfovibrio sp.]|nr:UvrD-helicase domain-containing protein [Desulfovibrio sp.]